MEREILHLVVPAFPIALARVCEGRLRERPVAVAPGNSERAVVQCVSKEAAAEGIVAGMPLFRAKRMCPALSVIPPNPLLLSKGTKALADLASDFTPVVEPGAGRIFLDVTGSCRLFGPLRDIASRLENEISARLSLEVMAGTGGNKLVSRIAADALPEPGVYDVFKGAERSFIAPFPVSVIPGVGTEREAMLLRDLNLRHVKELAALSLPQLRLALGPAAPLIHERACGIDRSPVQPPRRAPEIVAETYLDQEENDDVILLTELFRLVEECGAKFRVMGKQVGKLNLTVNYADGVTEQSARRLPAPEANDLPLFVWAEELFHATCRRRIRVRGLRLCCEEVRVQGQMELFPPVNKSPLQDNGLQRVVDSLREKFGTDAISWGRSMRHHDRRMKSADTSAPTDLSEYRYCTQTTRGG